MNWGVRFVDNFHARYFTCAINTLKAIAFLNKLSLEVSDRMKHQQASGRCITLKLKKKIAGAPEPMKYLGIRC